MAKAQLEREFEQEFLVNRRSHRSAIGIAVPEKIQY
jgi:hypothetical protein